MNLNRFDCELISRLLREKRQNKFFTIFILVLINLCFTVFLYLYIKNPVLGIEWAYILLSVILVLNIGILMVYVFCNKQINNLIQKK